MGDGRYKRGGGWGCGGSRGISDGLLRCSVLFVDSSHSIELFHVVSGPGAEPQESQVCCSRGGKYVSKDRVVEYLHTSLVIISVLTRSEVTYECKFIKISMLSGSFFSSVCVSSCWIKG